MRLQAKLLLFVAPCAILSLVLIYLFTNAGLHDRTSRQLLTEMNLALDLADLQFRQFITTANADASLLAGMPSERAHASASEQNSQARALQEQLQNAVARFQEAHSEHLALSTAFESISREIFWSAVDDKGQIILHADRSLIGNVDRELLQDASTVSASGKIDNALYRGVPTIITRKPLTDNLSMVALLPESAVQDSYVEFSDQLTIVSAVSTFMGIATFFTLLRFFVMRPLIRLRHLAMSIGREPPDNTHACMDVQRRDEIGDLSRAFKETSERLQLSMSELQDSHSQIETLAYRDALTGLANRRLFNQMAELRIQEAREQGHGLCVLFLDLDDFKRINDTQGHKAGDRLLETVSERLLNCLAETAPGADCVHTSRPEDNTVARMGGDEFIVLLPHSDNGNEGEAAAARILDAMARPISLNEHEFVVSTSIGIAQYPTHADNVDDLVKCADAAMYEAKRLNKNNYRTYGSDIQQMLEDRLQLELDLRQAMPKEQLSLVYQPQYCVDGMEIVGAEALLRWQHPDRGMIPPDVFIAIAEERDLIDKIGAWVLDEACRQWKQWQNSGIELKHIAVNVSARQFACGNIQQLVDEVLKRYDMPASALELELTESCIIESPQEMFNTLSDLRASGIAIAMDDFGTGYSSLSTIATMPVDTLKIDRSFMTNLTIGSPNEKIVSAILMLADGLKMQVVAEGVEQQSELDFLKSRQCDMAQGYYLARPLNVHDMTALLHEQADRRFRQTG